MVLNRALNTNPRNDAEFGRVAVEHGFVSPRQLEECFRVQCNSSFPRHLGMVMLELGYIKDDDLPVLLELQQKDREAALKSKESTIEGPPMAPDEIRAIQENIAKKKGKRDPWLGKILNDWLLIDRLGYGGMGVVYRARNVRNARDFALKMLSPQYSENRDYVRRFLREAKLAGSIRHPNVVSVREAGHADGVYFMVMELVEGKALDEIIYARGFPTMEQSLSIVKQALEGVREAHLMGIVHRDLKPENLLLTEEMFLKVTDFGLARMTGGFSNLTRSGHVVGSPRFMSPEQCDGFQVDHRTDIYSLGITLYYLLTGVYPFDGETPTAIMLKHQTETPKSPKVHNPRIPNALANLIYWMLQKRPEKRPATVDHVLESLARVDFNKANSGPDMFERESRRLSTARLSGDDIDRAVAQQKRFASEQNLQVPLGEILAKDGLLHYEDEAPAQVARLAYACLRCKHAVDPVASLAMRRVRCLGCNLRVRLTRHVRLGKLAGRMAVAVQGEGLDRKRDQVMVRQLVAEFAAQRDVRLVVDLSKTSGINSEYITILVEGAKALAANGGSLTVIAAGRRDVKKMTSFGLNQVVAIFPSREAFKEAEPGKAT
ncbi:MAG: protein kinase [Planctomycetes bacterium]|nr:protein kinase [Planctomycetota bacterium]